MIGKEMSCLTNDSMNSQAVLFGRLGEWESRVASEPISLVERAGL